MFQWVDFTYFLHLIIAVRSKFCYFLNFCSKFGDIFDEEFFIYALRNHVNVIKELPEETLQRFDHNISSIVNLRVKAWSSPTYYLQKVLPKLLEMGYVMYTFYYQDLASNFTANFQLCPFNSPTCVYVVPNLWNQPISSLDYWEGCNQVH